MDRATMEMIWREWPCRFPGAKAGWRILDWELKQRGGYYRFVESTTVEFEYLPQPREEKAPRKTRNQPRQPCPGDVGEIVALRGQSTYNAAVAMRRKQRVRLDRGYGIR